MKKGLYFIAIITIFLIGFLSNTAYSYFMKNFYQTPYFGVIPKNSPQDIIKENQIIVTQENIIINIKNAEWSKYADTHSMEPLISSRANGLEIIPKCENIKSGDIIVYEAKWTSGLIVHRIVSVEKDDEGLFFRLKGDNTQTIDPEKVRCSQIKYQVIGIIY